MHSEWSEQKFLKGSVGHKIKLTFCNKCRMADLLFIQLVIYSKLLTTEFKYQPWD